MSDYRIFTWPNLVTVSGMLAIGLSIWLILHGYALAGLLIYIYAAVTDFIDGWLARWLEGHGYEGVSRAGEIMDPVRDKMLILVLMTIDWKLMLVAASLELISFLFSYQVRKTAGHHYITNISKVVTAVQLIIMGIMLAWPETYLLFGALYCLTLVRVASYAKRLLPSE